MANTCMWRKEQNLCRTYSQGYGAELLFQDVSTKADLAVDKNGAAAYIARDFADFGTAKFASPESQKIVETVRSYDFDVMQVISVGSQHQNLDTIPSFPGSILGSETEDVCSPWEYDDEESYPSELCTDMAPSRASSGAESILPYPCEVDNAIACVADLETSLDPDMDILPPSCGSQYASKLEQDILLPWDM